MFGINVIDSLGFLRIIDTPIDMSSAWGLVAGRCCLWRSAASASPLGSSNAIDGLQD
jgi:hypothetical protein